MVEIKARYDGKYPNACRGDLHIYVDGEEVYVTDMFSFHSTGTCGFGDDYSDEIVTCGNVRWNNDAYNKYKKWLKLQEFAEQIDIDEIVRDELDSFTGCCCGGCL